MEIFAKHQLVVRIKAFVFLVISLIVMVTDKTTDVVTSATDDSQVEVIQYSFRDLEAFRYVVAANAIGCLYSFIMIILGLSGTKRTVYFYLSCVIDQIMAYIVLSSASAGTAYIMFSKDLFQAQGLYGVAEKKFLRLAAVSVSMEFLGFIFMSASAGTSVYRFYSYLYSPTAHTVPAQGNPATNVDTKQQSPA